MTQGRAGQGMAPQGHSTTNQKQNAIKSQTPDKGGD